MQDYLFSNGVGIPPFPNVFNHLLDLLFRGAFDDVIGTRALVGSNEIRAISFMLFVNKPSLWFFFIMLETEVCLHGSYSCIEHIFNWWLRALLPYLKYSTSYKCKKEPKYNYTDCLVTPMPPTNESVAPVPKAATMLA